MNEWSIAREAGLALVRGASAAAAIIAALVIFFVFGPALEGYWFPVADEYDVMQIGEQGDAAILSVWGTNKRRCDFIEVSALARVGGTMTRSEVSFGGGSFVTRPLGRQSFGHWIVNPSGDRIALEVRHRCHPFWTTVTPVADISIRNEATKTDAGKIDGLRSTSPTVTVERTR